MRPRTAVGAVLAAFTLSGCVMAVPFAAAGALAGSRGIRGETIDSVEQKRLAKAAASAQEAATEASVDDRPSAFVLSDLTELPPSSGGTTRPDFFAVQSFASYASEQAQSDAAISARLTRPGLMRPDRAACEGRPPVVVIDLDPGRETFDPFTTSAPDPAFLATLAQLRGSEVLIAWQSRLGEAFADRLRETLSDSGLDVEGRDRLLLLPSIEERKQTRREQLEETHCIVAMLGDERADFDELYLYLKNPDAAIGLERMLGDGWFLAESLLATDPAQAASAPMEGSL